MGQPAARITDKVAGNVIVTGSATVLIGDSAEGCADGACKGSPSVGSPVNPILGIKVLPGETDFALAAPSPFVFTRSYASDDARIGPLGQGWSVPGVSLYLEVSEAATVLVDPQGRRITFGPMLPGEMRFSPSESLWLRRGGLPEGTDPADAEPWSGRWIGVPATAQRDARCIVALAVGSLSAFVFVERAGRWPLVQVCDRNGYTTSYQWSATGDLRGVQDSAGRLYAYVYQAVCPPTPADKGLRLIGVVLAHDPGRDGPAPTAPFDLTAKGLDWLVRFSFDADGNLVQVRNRMDQPIRYFGWREHILVRHGEPGGIDVRYTYDVYSPKGRVLTQVNAEGLSYRFDYHPQHTVVTDSLGRVDEYHFEGEGGLRRLVTHVRADSTRLVYVHDAAGRLISVTDPLGRVTRYRLDGEGRLLGETRPDGSVLNHRHDSVTGDLLDTETQPGRRTRYEVDARGRKLSETAPDGAVTRWLYESSTLPDRPTQIIDALGGVRRQSWDSTGLLVSETDCSGHTTRYTYDDTGALTSTTNALGQTTRFGRDRLGRLLQTTLPDGSTTRLELDPLGRVVVQTDALGQVTRMAYDRFGRMIRQVDPQGYCVAWAYDNAGRLVALTNENGAVYRFRHDVLDRVIEEVGYDGRCQRYCYSKAGELIESHDEGNIVIRREHDAMGRVVAIHLPATSFAPAQTHHFVYDAAGQIIEARTPDVTVKLRYDAAGRMLGESQLHADGWHYHYQHRYNALGVREASVYDGLPEVQWLTYGSGHLHGVRIGEVGLDFDRDVLHREVRRRGVLAQGVSGFDSRSAYDAVGQLVGQRVTDSDGQSVWARAYQRDALGRVVAIQDQRAGMIRYRHDPSGRLIGSDHAGQVSIYHFDPAGNRLDAPTDAHGTPVRWGDNRVGQVGGVQYRHDAAGNVVERSAVDGDRLELGYDARHQLIQLKRSGASKQLEGQYSYDAFGRRVRKEVSLVEGMATVTRFGWEGNRMVMEAGEWQACVLYEPDGFIPLMRAEIQVPVRDGRLTALHAELKLLGQTIPVHEFDKRASRVYAYHQEHLGTPVCVTDLYGILLWVARSDDWGAVRVADKFAFEQKLRFQGQQFDVESGLCFNRYRYFDSESSGYITQDPLGLPGGVNLYTYAQSAPTCHVDPLGLSWAKIEPITPIPSELPPFDRNKAWQDYLNSLKDKKSETVPGKDKKSEMGSGGCGGLGV